MIRFTDFSYRYPGSDVSLFEHFSLEIPAERFVWVAGPSASGKSTFLRALNGLVPHFYGGSVGGDLEVFGRRPVESGPRGMASSVALVFQNPEHQFVTETVEDELAFSMEQLGFHRSEMRARILKIAEALGLASLLERSVNDLSSGEKQKVAIGSALVLEPKVLLLDEPSSQLDSAASRSLYRMLRDLVDGGSLSVLCVEHQPREIAPLADTTLWFGGNGEAPRFLSPAETTSRLTSDEGAHALPQDPAVATVPIVAVENLSCRFDGTAPLFSHVDLALRRGECVAVVGPNGSGKTTLLRCIAGFHKPTEGRVLVEETDTRQSPPSRTLETLGFVPQFPGSLFFHESLREEIVATRRNRKLPDDEGAVVSVLEGFHLDHAIGSFPRNLSVGEQQRAAIATIVAGEPRVLLLDEPTRGMDRAGRQALIRTIRKQQERGTAVILVSHDSDLVRTLAGRVFELDRGRLS